MKHSVSVVAVVLVVACGDAPTDALQIASSTPAYGPLVGGTRITLVGAGFSSRLATPDRVLIAGKEAPLVAAIDDSRLDVVIPPGEQPGDAEIVVLHGDRNVRATGIFHYSTPPDITSVSPADVLFSSGSTPVMLSGSGFSDEGAGDVQVVVDGVVADVQVISDTSLTFIAPLGRALVRANIELEDRRGRTTKTRAFRYIPSPHRGLLLFPQFGAFAVFFDPLDNSSVSIPGNGGLQFTSVTHDAFGDYWVIDRARRFGRLDTGTQSIEAPIPAQGTLPTMVRIGDDYFALDRNTLHFGKLDPLTGGFTGVGPAIPCCGSYGLAFDGTTLYFVARQGTQINIATIDPATGATGTPVPITAGPAFHVEEMRFFDGTLYATSRDGTLVTIDPNTGVTTVLPVSLGRFNAMDVFE